MYHQPAITFQVRGTTTPRAPRVARLRDSDWGTLFFEWQDDTLTACILLPPNDTPADQRLTRRYHPIYTATPDPRLNAPSLAALNAFLAGNIAAYPPILAIGTPFQLAVWHRIAQIPRGQTTTYGAIARHLSTHANQSIGTAVGHNPISLFIPCHRVLPASGEIGNYAWGTPLKEKLLAHENTTNTH